VQTKEEKSKAAKGKAQLIAAEIARAGTRQWETIREIQILDELMGDLGVAQIVGVIAAGDHDTTRPLAILTERCPTNLHDLIACVPLPNLHYLLDPLGSAPSVCSLFLACHKSSTPGQPECELLS
jgi:hypothetical protein